ncbi:MAG: M56 family metallopeptidase [Anaerolineae bacterium]|nr:M56 family metallopeptidase [Anaerolineae bacterium]
MTPANSAKRAFWALLGLAAGSLVLLIFLLLWQAPQMARGVWLACQDAFSAVGGYLPAIGLLLPLAVIVIAAVRFVRSLVVQLWNTRLLVAAMQKRMIVLPAALDDRIGELELAGHLHLVTDRAAYTFTQGLLRPQVWLSTGLVDLLDEPELRAVLVHERHHIRQHDPLRVLLSRSLAEALFFLPLAGSLRDTYMAAKEVEADQASAADNALASALLKLLRHGHALPANASLAAIGPMDVTRKRIDRLVHQAPGLRFSDVVRLRHVVASVALALVLMATSYVATTRASAPLDGGECGYTTAPLELQAPVTPADFTPANFDPVQ